MNLFDILKLKLSFCLQIALFVIKLVRFHATRVMLPLRTHAARGLGSSKTGHQRHLTACRYL